MSDKKPSMLSAFTEATRSAAPAAAVRAPRAVAPRRPRTPRQQDARASAGAPARASGPRKNLIYRTSRPNWERIKHLAISDDVSVQALFHVALSREFERRGLPPLTD